MSVDFEKVGKRMKRLLGDFIAQASEDGDTDRVRELEGVEVTICDFKSGKSVKVKVDPFSSV